MAIEADDFSLFKSHKQQQTPTARVHKVEPGDTLFAIAFRYGKSVEALATLNRIAPPYLIRPSQILQITQNSSDFQRAVTLPPSEKAPVAAPTKIVQQPPPPPLGAPPAKTKAKPIAKPKPVAAPTAAPTPPRSAPAGAATIKAATPIRQKNQSKPAIAPKPAKKTAAPSSQVSRWRWPAKGQVVGRFGSNGGLNKGVDIAGQLKEPILAARDGVVVYAGSGLRGYGKLIIIKHDDIYLSAYAHCDDLLVTEGSRVGSGQTIARMGSSGTDRVMLHFEVRKSGTPVDPLQFLPRR